MSRDKLFVFLIEDKCYFCAMKKFLVSMFFSLACLFAVAQTVDLWSAEADAENFYVDKLGNIYLVKNNVVGKYDDKMNKLCSYDNYSAGSISSVDVANPFKIIVFYSEFNKVVYLDNNLAELRSPIMIDDAGFYNIRAVCSSSFGGFWIFDEQDICVRRIETDLSSTQKGTNLYESLGDANVLEMKESINYLFLRSETGKILVLDRFGNYFRTVEVGEDCSRFCVDNDILYVNSSGKIKIYDMTAEKEGEILLDGKEASIFCVWHDMLYVLSNGKITCSKIQFEK